MIRLTEPQNRVRDVISSHYHRSSSPITQKMISTETGLAIPRVREALNSLSREGLIEWKPNFPNSIRPKNAKTIQADSRTLSALRSTCQSLKMVYQMLLRYERLHSIPIGLEDSKKLAQAHDVMRLGQQLLVLNGVEING